MAAPGRATRRGVWPPALPQGAVDGLVALALGAAVTLASLASDEPDSRPASVAAYVAGAGVAAVTLARRRWPVTVLALTGLVVLAYHATNFPAIGHWPLVVGLYTCATLGRLRAAILVGGATVTLATATWLVFDAQPLLPVVSAGLREVAALGAALALGDAVRSRRGWSAETRERVRRVAREREQEARRRLVEERLRIARELHDITAHTLAVVGVQLNVAADTLTDAPEQARAALRTAQQANREAVAELKAAVRVLRQENDGVPPRTPTPGLDQVQRVLAAAREAGLVVDYRESGRPRALPAPVGLAVHRVIQESITNVLRHADATTVRVSVDYRPTELAVTVVDDGRGAVGSPPGETGHGLIGMRERVRGLGGTFTAGQARGGRGFAVSATIPLDPAPDDGLDSGPEPGAGRPTDVAPEEEPRR